MTTREGEKVLTVKDVKARVAVIAAESKNGGDEEGHKLEDALHREVLQAIALNKCADPAMCAAVALRTDALNFSRWYA